MPYLPAIPHPVRVAPAIPGMGRWTGTHVTLRPDVFSRHDWATLFVALHEIGHKMSGHTGRTELTLAESAAHEVQANMWAIAYMEANGPALIEAWGENNVIRAYLYAHETLESQD